MGTYTVVYDDPKRTSGPSHSLHLGGCKDPQIAKERAGCSVHDIEADTTEEALVIAQHQGLTPSDDTNLGEVYTAPCLRKRVTTVNP